MAKKKVAQSAPKSADAGPLVLTSERSEIALEACYQIEGLCDELNEQARSIDRECAEVMQQVATIRAIASRLKALSKVARDFVYIDPLSRPRKEHAERLKRVVHDGWDYESQGPQRVEVAHG